MLAERPRRALAVSLCVTWGLSWGGLEVGTALAEPVGVKTVIVTEKPGDPAFACNDLDLTTCQVLVEFDEPEDNLLNVAFTHICASVDNDSLFQVPAAIGGSNTAPLDILVDAFPDLLCDSFVTIGLTSVASGQNDCTTLDPDFDAAGFNSANPLTGGWYCSVPPSGQGLAGNYTDNRVLIGQFSAPFLCNVSGFVTVFYNDGTTPFEAAFQCDLCPWACADDAALCDDDNHCTFDSCASPRHDCFGCNHHSIDLDGNQKIDAGDLSILLGGWGPGSARPADYNSDGAVNAFDLGLLLGNWGACR